MDQTQSLPPPDRLLPHARPFLFLDEILEVDAELGRFRWRFPADDPGNYATRMFPELALVEALTQATAAWSAIAIPKEGPEEGFLVAAERFVFQRRPQPGEDLELRVFRRKVFGGLALFRVEAHHGRDLVCSGEVTVFRDGVQGELPRLPQDARSDADDDLLGGRGGQD